MAPPREMTTRSKGTTAFESGPSGNTLPPSGVTPATRNLGRAPSSTRCDSGRLRARGKSSYGPGRSTRCHARRIDGDEALQHGEIPLQAGPRGHRARGRARHRARLRVRAPGPADLRGHELPTGRVLAEFEHQEHEHSKARDAGDRVNHQPPEPMEDAPAERPPLLR